VRQETEGERGRRRKKGKRWGEKDKEEEFREWEVGGIRE